MQSMMKWNGAQGKKWLDDIVNCLDDGLICVVLRFDMEWFERNRLEYDTARYSAAPNSCPANVPEN